MFGQVEAALFAGYPPRSPTPDAQTFTALFSHPLYEFRGRRFTQNDKSRVYRFLFDYVIQRCLRELVLTGDLTVRTPFPLEPGEAAMYREMAEELLMDAGLRQPRIEVAGGSAREARGRHPVAVWTDAGSDSS